MTETVTIPARIEIGELRLDGPIRKNVRSLASALTGSLRQAGSQPRRWINSHVLLRMAFQ